jgi:hypothetical protein
MSDRGLTAEAQKLISVTGSPAAMISWRSKKANFNQFDQASDTPGAGMSALRAPSSSINGAQGSLPQLSCDWKRRKPHSSEEACLNVWSTFRFGSGYQSVLCFVRALRGSMAPEARAIIETPPGEECQVDYGTGPMVRDPVTGKYRRTRLFVLTLGCSRKSVRLLAFRSSARVWAELHEKASGGWVEQHESPFWQGSAVTP